MCVGCVSGWLHRWVDYQPSLPIAAARLMRPCTSSANARQMSKNMDIRSGEFPFLDMSHALPNSRAGLLWETWKVLRGPTRPSWDHRQKHVCG
jgi:hypothetical protein